MAEAAGQFQKALDQLALLPDTLERKRQELDFYIGLGAASQTSKGFSAAETGRAYAHASELWEQLGCPVEYLRAPMGHSGYYTNRGELELAQCLNTHILRLAYRRTEPSTRCMGHVITGRTLTFAGKFVKARSHLEKAEALYDQIPLRWSSQPSGLVPPVGARGYLATILFCLGYPDQAFAKTRANIAYASRIAHTPSITLAHIFGATLFLLLGDDIALQGEVQQVVSAATEHGFGLYLAQGTIFRGWLDIQRGNIPEGLHLVKSGLDAYRSMGSLVWVPQYLGILVTAYEAAGQIEDALIAANTALQIVERTGERWFAAELNRHKGQLLVQSGNVGAAEEQFYEALRIAQSQGAKLWELRAAMSLARLRRDQGRRNEACHLLRSAYGCFTEGLAVPDLRAAKKLLDELGG